MAGERPPFTAATSDPGFDQRDDAGAERGLSEIGVDPSEISKRLGNIQNRIDRAQTGARWQRGIVLQLDRDHEREESLRRMLELYIEHVASGEPVSTWVSEA